MGGAAGGGVVSDATTRPEPDPDRQGLSGVADAVINTARTGAAKPDPRVYRIAAERVGAAPGRCLFVDDTGANAAAARREGMTALHYRRPEDLRAVLAPLLDAAGSRARQS
ncbi:HAD-IA family hydrolase [Streptomyces sp. NPDC088730]|uniref:HAD-IA family hydrolase n=1 Tax=Streptomyces sp. NPDC088730 TaxID=3365877 RepID=UPI003800AA13